MLSMVIGALEFTFALYVYYLAYCTLRVAKGNGKLAAAPKIVQAVAYIVLLVAVVMDVVFNVLIGSIVFLELPHPKRLLFTARCKYHMLDTDWRGRLARWVCEGWLNPFDDGHC